MKSYIVFGCGRFGASVASTLYKMGNEVLIVDRDYDVIQDITPFVTDAIQADLADESALEELGIGNFDVAIIAIGTNLEASIITTIFAKDKGVETIVAKAVSEMQGRVLEKLGVDYIIYPERDMGARLAHQLSSRSVIDYIYYSKDYGIMEMKVLNDWIGKTLQDINFRNKFKTSVIAIKHGDNIKVTPGSEELLLEGDTLVVMGKEEYLKAIEKL